MDMNAHYLFAGSLTPMQTTMPTCPVVQYTVYISHCASMLGDEQRYILSGTVLHASDDIQRYMMLAVSSAVCRLVVSCALCLSQGT